jgi:hypothetical protein
MWRLCHFFFIIDVDRKRIDKMYEKADGKLIFDNMGLLVSPTSKNFRQWIGPGQVWFVTLEIAIQLTFIHHIVVHSSCMGCHPAGQVTSMPDVGIACAEDNSQGRDACKGQCTHDSAFCQRVRRNSSHTIKPEGNSGTSDLVDKGKKDEVIHAKHGIRLHFWVKSGSEE